jgi:serine protease Do
MRSHGREAFTRRALLSAAGTAALASLAGCSTTAADPFAGEGGTPTTIEPTDSETTTGETATVTRTPAATDGDAFDDETIRRARETGIAVRDSVLAMSPDPPRIQGTGWYFDAADLVVTAGHLFAATDDWVAWQPDGTRLDPDYLDDAYLLGVDVGAMRAEVTGAPLPAGDADALDDGQPLVQVGNPIGAGNWVISLGRYLGETDSEADGFRTSVPGEGGSSGSPTLTLDGEVVGLNSGVEFIDRSEEATETGEPAVYAPDDRWLVSEHVGLDAITDQVEEWTDE